MLPTKQRINAAKPRILVISFSDLSTDPRVSRQIDLLRKSFAVTAIGFAPPKADGVEFIGVPRQHWNTRQKFSAAALLKLGKYEMAYWSSVAASSAHAAIQGREFDLILANDILALPLAVKVRRSATLLFDAHEYAPLEFEESWKWRFFLQKFNQYLCHTYLPQVDAMTTVCDGIAGEYHRNFGVRVDTINNAPPYCDISPSLSTERDVIRMIHHGAAIPSRQIETMIEASRLLDTRHVLDLMLVPSVPRYYEHLQTLAKGNPNIRFPPPVAMRELPFALNRYDVGIYLLQPNNFNNRFSLPNKFFEFVQARLAIAIGPSPEMAAYVKRFKIGVVSEDFSIPSFTKTLSALDHHQITYFKSNADQAARELCFEKNADTLLSLVNRLVNR
jgi:hypothetical protein